MHTQLIILAAGKGTRMSSDLPKVLVDFKGKPLIRRLLDNLDNLIKKLNPVIVVGHKKELVMDELGDNYIYAYQGEQLGTAHAVLSARSQIQADNAIVLYGDMPFIKAGSIERLIELFEKNNSKFAMFTSTVPNFENEYQTYSNYGRIIREKGKLKKIVEAKYASPSETAIKEVNPGIYMFGTDWLWNNIDKVQKNTQGEYYLTDLLEIAEKEGIEVITESIDPFEVYGINTLEQLKTAQRLLD